MLVFAKQNMHMVRHDRTRVASVALGFDDLSTDLQRATINAGDLDTRATYAARAWLTRDKEGEWKVTLFDCRRCSTQS